MEPHPESKVGFRITSDPDVTRIHTEQPQPATRKDEMLPLRLLLVSDLRPHLAGSVDWSAGSRLASVDKNSFGDLFKAAAPRLSISVDNHVTGGPAHIDLALSFSSLADFHPEGLVSQIPALQTLHRVRSLTAQVKDHSLSLDAFRDALKADGLDAAWVDQLYQALKPAAPSRPHPAGRPGRPSEKEDALSNLLGMIDLGDGANEPPPSRPAPSDVMGALLDAVSGGEAGPDTGAATAIMADLDETLRAQLNAVVHHPAFQRLEAAWRGLKFLVDRLNFRENIQLDVLAVPKAELASALYHQVLIPEHSGEPEVPLAVVLLDYLFDTSAPDLDALDDLAETGASLQTPMVTGVGPAFFGLKPDGDVASLPVLWQHFERPAYAAWNTLRKKDKARYLAVVPTRFLLRFPYGKNNPVKSFDFTEDGARERGAQVWGNGALAVGAAMGASFAETGWPTRINQGPSAVIHDLPIWHARAGFIPLDALLSNHQQPEFAKAGFVVLGCRVNHDAGHLLAVPTIHDPGSFDDPDETAEAHLSATLPAQVLMGRFVHGLLSVQQELPVGLSADEVQARFKQRILAYMGATMTPDRVMVEVTDAPDTAGRYRVAVRVRPPVDVLGREFNFGLALDVAK